jgi:hypothetical protein
MDDSLFTFQARETKAGNLLAVKETNFTGNGISEGFLNTILNRLIRYEFASELTEKSMVLTPFNVKGVDVLRYASSK